jgi:5-formyltetrahydrofolate cyclo-ligase
MNKTRSAWRKELRAARRALTPAQQQAAAKTLSRKLRNWLPLLRSQHIAFYLPNDGEIDPQPLIHHLLQLGKSCYLPCLHADGSNRVWFVRYRRGEKLYNNRFGIPEPDRCNRRRPAWALQTVLMPLVGFDHTGNRLGMGGGFYDRTFAFKRIHKTRKPLLVGLAHSIQEAELLPAESWDMPLDFIATEAFVLDFSVAH